MDEELCFIIDDKRLYMEQILIDYNEIPVFYICSCKKDLFLVLCIDIAEQEFYISKINDIILLDLFEKNITMKEGILEGSCFWQVKAGQQIQDDEVKSIHKEDICVAYLPQTGSFFNVFSDELYEYKKKIQKKLYNNDSNWKQLENVKKDYIFYASTVEDCMLIESDIKKIYSQHYIEYYKRICLFLNSVEKDVNNNENNNENKEDKMECIFVDMNNTRVIIDIYNDEWPLVA